jgi:hypothetical protein
VIDVLVIEPSGTLRFIWPTFSQSTEAVCEGLDRAWWFFGGMPRTIVPDNRESGDARAADGAVQRAVVG